MPIPNAITTGIQGMLQQEENSHTARPMRGEESRAIGLHIKGYFITSLPRKKKRKKKTIKGAKRQKNYTRNTK